MKIIGICGSSGSGKSTVCKILSSFGAAVLDCDEIYHELVSQRTPCLEEIASEFGADLIENEKLNRTKLSRIVYSDSKKLERLNEITHRHILSELKNRLEKLQNASQKVAVIDAPLLYEAGLDKWCYLVCAVLSDPNEQVLRLCMRDKISKEDAQKRLQNQLPQEELRRKANFVIENSANFDSLTDQCKKLFDLVL